MHSGSPDPDVRIGVNLFGYLSGNLGLGVSARHYLRFLSEAGIDVAPVEVPVTGGRANHDLSLAERWLTLDQPTPHDVNLFVINPLELMALASAGHPALCMVGRVNLCLPFWELPWLPPRWLPALAGIDVVLAASEFIRYAALASLPDTCVRALGHPIYLPADAATDRRRWGIDADHVAFVFSFEMASDINRKNPFAAMDAFELAFGAHGAGPARLVVKVNNSTSEPGFEPHLEQLVARAARNPALRLVDEVLPYPDVIGLFGSCDVFVSLHRAEGLGLCLMEAMTLGKPVVTTAWSGNMGFTSERNACLVDYRLVPLRNTTQANYDEAVIGRDARWAEPDIEHAAHWMRRLVDEPALRQRIGARAAADLAAHQRGLDAGELVATVRNLQARRGR